MPKKLVLGGVVVVGLFLLAIVAVLFVEFDSPELGRLALGQVGKASGFDLEAKGFRLNLLRGLELEEVEARATDGGMAASMDRLVLKHRPSDLFGGTLTVTEVLIEKPRVEVVSTLEASGETAASGTSAPPDGAESANEGPGGDAESGDATSLDLTISKIQLRDGKLVQRVDLSNGGMETTEIRGLQVALQDLKLGSAGEESAGQGEVRIAEVEMRSGQEAMYFRDLEVDLETLALGRGLALASTSMTGDVRVAEVVSASGEVSTTQAEDLSGRLGLAAGDLKLQEMELKTPQGSLKGEIGADIAADPLTYSIDLRGDALSTGVLLGIGNIGGLGTSVFELKASGEGSDPAQMLGQGRLTINGGKLPDHPALAQVEKLLGNVALIGAGYEAFPMQFDIRSQRIHLEPCELTVGPVSLNLGGWVDFEGPLEMELTALVPPEGLQIKEIPAEVLEALSEPDGRVNLPMLMTGTPEASTVALNQAFLKELGKRYVKKRAQQEIGKALGRLFGDN